MKLPALLIAVSVAAGVLAAPLIAAHAKHSSAFLFAATLSCIALGFFSLLLRRTNLAWSLGLLVWFFLGASAAQIERMTIPANQVTNLISEGKLELQQPLRWRGILHADPLRLPWGIRYDIDLQMVQTAGEWQAVHGGLRASYFFDRRIQESLPPIRAGNLVELLVRARAVRNFGDPGAFDYRGALRQQGVDLTATLRNPALIQPLPGSRPSLSHYVARLRGDLLNELDVMLAPADDRRAIARAMLLGDRSFLDSEQADSFRQTGAFHILVVAGLHVGVLTAFLFWIGKKLRLPMPARALLTIAALCFYLGIVEDRPPIVRAALMAVIYLLARMLYRQVALLNVVSISAVIILMMRPSEISQASFQLSFLAAAIIAAIAQPLLERTEEPYRRALDHLGDVTHDRSHAPKVAEFRLDLRTVSDWLRSRLPVILKKYADDFVALPCRFGLRLWELAVLSIALQLGMLPLMARDFHRVSLVAPLANVPAVLLTGVIVPFGFASLAIAAIWRQLGLLLGHGLSFLIALLATCIHRFAQFPAASVRVPSPPPLLLIIFFAAALIFSAAISIGKSRQSFLSFVVVSGCAALMVIYPFRPQLQTGRLEVTVLDVGQGDSIFVAFPDGRTMLVDAGGLPGANYLHGMRPGLDVGEDVVSPFLWSHGLKRIDTIVITHAHEDHIGGMPAVLRNFRVGELWVGRDEDAPAYRNVLAEAAARRIPVVHRLRGEHFDWSGARVTVLWPDSSDPARARNDDSLVLRLEDGSDSFLLTGDIERAVERSIVADGDELATSFLKVPHHGGKTSSTMPFLDAVRPAFAAISVGEANPFGHPSADAIDRIRAEGSRIYRTDRDGAITAQTDGHSLTIRPFFACEHPCSGLSSSANSSAESPAF